MKFKKIVLIVTVATSLFFGCRKTPHIELSTTTVLGRYKGHYDNGLSEMFTIKPDGTFVQVLSEGSRTIYSNDGHWKIDTSQKDDNQVIFYNIILAVDAWQNNSGKPKDQDIYRAHWSPYGPIIVFAEKDHFWVEKVTE